MAEIERVIEQLKQLEHCITKSCDETCTYYEDDMYHCQYDVSTEETVENAIQTIRELQSKSEEVCEWEKASEDDMSIWKYYPECKGMTDVDISGFHYCPYCGRKIRVVE